MTAGSRIDDGGKVAGKILGTLIVVKQRECKGGLQRNLGRSDGFTVFIVEGIDKSSCLARAETGSFILSGGLLRFSLFSHSTPHSCGRRHAKQ